MCETLLNQLRSGTISCSFVQVKTRIYLCILNIHFCVQELLSKAVTTIVFHNRSDDDYYLKIFRGFSSCSSLSPVFACTGWRGVLLRLQLWLYPQRRADEVHLISHFWLLPAQLSWSGPKQRGDECLPQSISNILLPQEPRVHELRVFLWWDNDVQVWC